MAEHFLHGQILFGQVSPEILLQSLLKREEMCMDSRHNTSFKLNAKEVSEKAYLHFSLMFAANARKTVDEQIQRYRELEDFLDDDCPGGVFRLLADYGDRMLNLYDADPKVRQDKILEWREISLSLGQDLFTCAALAQKDVRERAQRYSFGWPPAVLSDNIPLRHILERGCAENHYHLNGSTQIFPLAWCYLMNHPAKLAEYFARKELQDGLSVRSGTSIQDNAIGWVDKMNLAAWIRVHLFSQLVGRGDTDETPQTLGEYYRQPDRRYQLRSLVKQYRCHAAPLAQGRKKYRLDYAITYNLAESNKGPTRLLAGERNFLYQCFYRCYSGTFEPEEMNLLYLYLLIKREFRNELVQTNGRRGFWNFSDYQDRKALVWGDSPEYWRESYILSLAENLGGPRMGKSVLQTLEARIVPKQTAPELLKNIRDIDCTVEEYQDQQIFKSKQQEILPRKERYWKRAQENAQYFYVLHFPKIPLRKASDIQRENLEMPWLPARNQDVREQSMVQSKALAKGLAGSSYLCSRIRGIDACSREIGCRPETFATQFRYLRSSLVSRPRPSYLLRYWPKLRATFHVGEDFLDLTDGLRAIDEAICFLNLEQGDRLGHAMALGISPYQYYRVKDNTVWLPAQDLLDNLVWILYRSLGWDVCIPSSLREMLRERAQQLLETIYPNENGDSVALTLRTYFEAWQLRGDDPKLYWQYQTGDEDTKRILENSSLLWDEPYKRAMLHVGKNEDGVDLRARLRRSPQICRILVRYHFGLRERQEGEKSVRFVATPEFAAVLEKLQVRMMEKIMAKGIAVECNPSSNHLIGTFDRYEEHPIFRFNHFGLSIPEHKSSSGQIRVSINTDDLGVFDTSIENEYALLFGALCGLRDAEGKQLLCHDEILNYLDHVRVMGNDMVFPKAERARWEEQL